MIGISSPYKILRWDSDFFGLKVAMLTENRLTTKELTNSLKQMKEQQIKIVYWSSIIRFNEGLINKLNGKLVDKKVTFIVNLKYANKHNPAFNNGVEFFTSSMPIDALDSLAIQAGKYSRFARDPNIPKDKFLGLYKQWMKKSITKELASNILIIKIDNFIAAMATLGEKNGRGDIGLIAVDQHFRRKQYGKNLVQAAQKWFLNKGYIYGQVVTQTDNITACKLYKKCGYSIENIEYFYHFWL